MRLFFIPPFTMGNTSANVRVEFRKFDGIGFDLWKVRMENTLYLQECAEALEENKSAGITSCIFLSWLHRVPLIAVFKHRIL